MLPQYTTSDINRFWAKVNKTETCWIWTHGTNGVGYGYFGLRHNRPITAHRFAYILTYGDIPNGMLVLHHCDNRACCNPDHLFLGTHKNNTQDMLNKEREARGERHGIGATEVFYIVHRKVWDHI